jgi:hypothetical protein
MPALWKPSYRLAVVALEPAAHLRRMRWRAAGVAALTNEGVEYTFGRFRDGTGKMRNHAMHTERRLVCGFQMVRSSIAAALTVTFCPETLARRIETQRHRADARCFLRGLCVLCGSPFLFFGQRMPGRHGRPRWHFEGRTVGWARSTMLMPASCSVDDFVRTLTLRQRELFRLNLTRRSLRCHRSSEGHGGLRTGSQD